MWKMCPLKVESKRLVFVVLLLFAVKKSASLIYYLYMILLYKYSKG